jgi:hypothetical protein
VEKHGKSAGQGGGQAADNLCKGVGKSAAGAGPLQVVPQDPQEDDPESTGLPQEIRRGNWLKTNGSVQLSPSTHRFY